MGYYFNPLKYYFIKSYRNKNRNYKTKLSAKRKKRQKKDNKEVDFELL